MAILMSKRTGIIVFLLFIFMTVVALGPRPTLRRYHPPELQLPDDLDSYLTASEARASGIRRGTEKTILWSRADKGRTALSLVYLHGFSASRGELSPVVENVAKRVQANLFFTRLRGHGQDGSALANAKPAELLDDGYEALAIGRRLGEKTIVIGTSTGATLGTWMAAKQADIDALILLSPNFALKDKRTLLLELPWGIYLAKALVGPERTWEPENALEALYWTYRYPLESLLPMLAILRSLSTDDMRRIQIPTLILYTPQDDRVDVQRIETYYKAIASPKKRIIRLDEAKSHVLAGNAVSPQTTELVSEILVEFLKEL